MVLTFLVLPKILFRYGIKKHAKLITKRCTKRRVAQAFGVIARQDSS